MTEAIRILTLYEPWASFMARGYKLWETRCWATPYRGLVAIHAAKTDEYVDEAGMKMVEAGIKKSLFEPDPFLTDDGAWPLGCILSVGRLVACVPTETANPSRQERAMGDYSPKRFAWQFENMKRIQPFPHVGRQGLTDLNLEIARRFKYLQLV